MNKIDFNKIEKYMLSCMNNRDIAHDSNHMNRVLYNALEMIKDLSVEADILIASCLLHDIGREIEFQNPHVDHAKIGSEMAYDFLKSIGWNSKEAEKVRKCILNHRKKINDAEVSMEAKLLYDADKLDIIGAIGIARNIAYNSMLSEPFYSTSNNNKVVNKSNVSMSTFIEDLKEDFDGIHNKFYTDEAKLIAEQRIIINKQYYSALHSEIESIHLNGAKHIEKHLN